MDIKQQVDQLVGNVKDALKLGNRTVIGVDIGLSQVKLAELKKSGSTYKLVNYAAVDLPEGSLIEDEIQKPDEILKSLEQAIELSGTSATSVAIALFGPNTVARKLQLAGGSYEEIDDQVSWEAEQYLPFSIDDSMLSFHIFGENDGGGVDVLVAAARSDLLLNFKELIEKSKLRVKIVDLGLIATTNVFEHVLADRLNDPSKSWVLMDIGAQKTSFIIYRQGAIVFAKEMNIGGVMITEEIQRQMGVNYFEAEDLKMTGDENGNLPEEILEIIDDILEAFFAEIKKTVDFYISSTSDESLSECVITGGGALIPGITEGLEALLSYPVMVLNPFDVIEYDKKKFDEEMINSIAFRGVVALGLGMRELK